MQHRLLVLGLASQAVLPREAQHVLHRVVDTQSAGVVERGAALVILTAEQGRHTAQLKVGHITKTFIYSYVVMSNNICKIERFSTVCSHAR